MHSFADIRGIIATTVIALSAAISGCTLDVPQSTEAQVVINAGKSDEQRSMLSSGQRNRLSDWLSKHQTGWSKSYVTYAPATELRLKHADGSVSVINITSSKVIAYGNFGQYEQAFPQETMSQLWSAIGIK